jgi:hypothetical protein
VAARKTCNFPEYCDFSALAENSRRAIVDSLFKQGHLMKKMLVVICSLVLALSLAGCGWGPWGKGKAPIIGKGKAPAPVVTKG